MPQETKYCHSSALATFPFQGSGVEVVDESGTLWTWGGSAYLKPVGSRKDPVTGLYELDEGSREVMANSGVVVAWDTTHLVELLAEYSSDASAGGWIHLRPGVTYTPADPLTMNTAKLGLHMMGATIDVQAMDGEKAINLIYSPQDTAGGNRYRHYMYEIGHGRIIGPGRDSLSTGACFYANGTVGNGVTLVGGIPLPIGLNMSVRPVLRGLVIEGFYKGFEGQDVFFLSHLENVMFYRNAIGFSQNSGSDSGETVTIRGGSFANNYLGIYAADSGSEIKVSDTSISYNRQSVCIDGNNIRVYLDRVHDEFRGANLVDDNGNYALDGSGTDVRAAIAGKDSYYYVGGTNSYLRKTCGVLDANNSGGAAPYAWDNLCKVVDITGTADFIGVTPSNLRNTSGKFATGAGRTRWSETQVAASPTMPYRLSDSSNSNALFDGGFEQAQITDNWSITRDTAEITDRHTGTNITLARSTGLFRSGAASLLASKASSATGIFGCFVPVTVGQRCMFHGYYNFPTAPTTAGNFFISVFWVRIDRDRVTAVSTANGALTTRAVPMYGAPDQSSASSWDLGLAKSAQVSGTGTLNSATSAGSWLEFKAGPYDNGAAGSPSAPDWATHAFLEFNVGSLTASAYPVQMHIDDVTVSYL